MATAAYWMLAAGLVGALAAIPFGLADFSGIPDNTRARRIGLLHGGGNAVVFVLFLVSWWLRDMGQPPPATAVWFSLAGLLLALVTAWLGGELVAKLGVGVHEDAGLNAPSSLDRR
jgi:uncharacterized membrane protein